MLSVSSAIKSLRSIKGGGSKRISAAACHATPRPTIPSASPFTLTGMDPRTCTRSNDEEEKQHNGMLSDRILRGA